MSVRNTKIVATLGPASCTKEKILQMIRAGMDVARINFSHGDYVTHGRMIRLVRVAAEELHKPIGIVQDLSGPKLRIDAVKPGSVKLEQGSRIIVTTVPVMGSSEKVSVSSFPSLVKHVKKYDRILMNDGAVCLYVESIKGKDIVCRVKVGGWISSHKGLNLPDTHLSSLPGLTAKDKADCVFGLKHDVDFVALSFVRTARDIRELKNLVRKSRKNIPVIAKIEKHEALEHLEDIIRESDGIMVARGDLGVETELETVTLKQKEIIRMCNRYGKMVITATQMLESMIEKPVPTRAEVSDITNAIFDGTDALMLSGETAVGAYPVSAVSHMARIAEKTEDSMNYERFLTARPIGSSISECVAHAACVLARDIDARAIITSTLSGSTARMISRYRPLPPIITVTSHKKILRQLNLVWGIYPFLIRYTRNTDRLIHEAKKIAYKSGIVKKGDTVVICAGNPLGKSGRTDLIKVEVL